MNKRVFGTIIHIFLLTCSIQAQKSKAAQNAPVHRIYVEFGKDHQLEYPFSVVKGSSVYGLAKVFDLDENLIYRYNGKSPGTTIEKGSVLRVPLKRENIVFSPPVYGKSIVLLYKVKPKETLFHISRRKMKMETAILKKINGLADDQLREGGEIILGWYIPATVPTSPRETENPVIQPKDRKNVVPEEVSPAETTENGEGNSEEPVVMARKRVIGYWDKNNQTKKGLFVLSDLAKPGTKMELYYPMNRTRVTATVIGRIPPSTYPEETELFISPEVAQKLGIFDTRFSVVTQFVALDTDR
jgi:LysM repeat protein